MNVMKFCPLIAVALVASGMVMAQHETATERVPEPPGGFPLPPAPAGTVSHAQQIGNRPADESSAGTPEQPQQSSASEQAVDVEQDTVSASSSEDAGTPKVALELREVPKELSSAYRGIVKIEVANRVPDYAMPWRSGQFGRGTGTGFMVAPGLFMTNAHVVANAQRIYVSPYADARKIPAKVEYVAHDADLALIKVEDTGAFKDVSALEFSDRMPKLEDEVRAIGFPIGGDRLSVTRGIVSRIDTIPYAHPFNQSHLIVQIDAAINPGNSGGPVLMDDKVVGVAFQGLMQANSTGYMIPLPVIQRFLKDVADGRYDHYVEIGAMFFPMQNPAMRRHYNRSHDTEGTLVGEVIPGNRGDQQLQVGDVVLAVNGHGVDNSAMIELDGERVKLEELAERSFAEDELTFTLVRDGKKMEVKIHPQPIDANNILGNEFDALPRYVLFAGLLFQPLQRDVIRAHNLDPNDFIVELDDFIRGGASLHKDDIVVLTDVLRDEVNARFSEYGTGIVTKVNGQEVKGLNHLYSLLFPEDGNRKGEYTVIEFKDAPRPFVVENAALQAAHARIQAGYNVPDVARLNESPHLP